MKKRKGHLEVEIDPKTFNRLKKVAKEKGKTVDDLAKEIFLKTIKTKKRGQK